MRIAIVAETSEIVRTGLVATIQSLGIFSRIDGVENFAQLQSHLENHPEPVLIANPSFFTHNQLHCLSKGYPALPMAAVSYFPFDETLHPPFHAIICLCDSSEKLHHKLTKLLKPIHPSPKQQGDGILSAREEEVLGLLVQGCSSKDIADRLFVSLHTVLTHRKNITRKLNIKSVAGLTVYAILNGIIFIEQVKQNI